MPFKIVEGDITKLETDAIVNAANNTLLGGGGVDGAIHQAAGPDLLKECINLHGCETGDAKITDAYNLPSKKVIHTVGPIWRGGTNNEPELLKSCYEKSLNLAKENNLESIAFPLISAGIYGYPKDKALEIASETIQDFIKENDMDVYLVIYNHSSFHLNKNLKENLEEYIKENLNKPDYLEAASFQREPNLQAVRKKIEFEEYEIDDELKKKIQNRGESFSEMLLRKIDESGLTDPECYKKANIDRRLFSKIKNNSDYSPSKETVLALALALELSIDETNELLEKAGYSLKSNKLSDIIIRYFIENDIFNIFTINEALFYYDQKLLA